MTAQAVRTSGGKAAVPAAIRRCNVVGSACRCGRNEDVWLLTERGVIGMLRENVNFKTKSQITIPKEFVERLGLKPGDILEARLEDGRIVLVPTVAVSKDQTWYWAREWQAEEQEVNEQQERGEIKGPMERDEALSVLDGLMRRDGH